MYRHLHKNNKMYKKNVFESAECKKKKENRY